MEFSIHGINNTKACRGLSFRGWKNELRYFGFKIFLTNSSTISKFHYNLKKIDFLSFLNKCHLVFWPPPNILYSRDFLFCICQIKISFKRNLELIVISLFSESLNDFVFFSKVTNYKIKLITIICFQQVKNSFVFFLFKSSKFDDLTNIHLKI